jgi:3-oxoacyl-[acyl-carrier-protein] synthase II
MSKRRVVITGISAITADSHTKDELWANLNSQHFFASEIQPSKEASYRFKSRFFVPFPEVRIDQHGFSPKHRHSMASNSAIALIAAKAAIEDAGFKLEPSDHGGYQSAELADTGVVLGVGIGALEIALSSHVAHSAQFAGASALQGYRFNKMAIPITMPNGPAAWISILLGLQGEAYTVNTACSSGNYAIAQACRRIASGGSNLMLSGGVECLRDPHGAIMRGFDTLGALTTSPNGHPQPFSTTRSGFLFSEGGAGILVLEELEHARKRGATIYAEIVDHALNSEGWHIVQMHETGTQIKKMIAQVKSDHKIDYFNAHGTGTVPNERVESAIIQDVFGSRSDQPYINSTKSIIGHTVGASAAIEAVVTALSIKHQQIHPNLADDTIDDLNVVVGKPLKTEIHYAISASYSFGGHNSALLFKRHD